jgi:hypothetical protein
MPGDMPGGTSVVEQPGVFDDEGSPEQLIRRNRRGVPAVVIDEKEPGPAAVEQRQANVRRDR